MREPCTARGGKNVARAYARKGQEVRCPCSRAARASCNVGTTANVPAPTATTLREGWGVMSPVSAAQRANAVLHVAVRVATVNVAGGSAGTSRR